MNKEVDYTKIDFPEHLNYGSNRVSLKRGELSIATALSEQKAEEIDLS